jgi:hypothetical protein
MGLRAEPVCGRGARLGRTDGRMPESVSTKPADCLQEKHDAVQSPMESVPHLIGFVLHYLVVL